MILKQSPFEFSPFHFRTGNPLDTIEGETHFIVYYNDRWSPGGHIFVFLVQPNVSGPTGTIAADGVNASVALLFLRVVQVNAILCMNTCIYQLQVEFLTAAYVIFSKC